VGDDKDRKAATLRESAGFLTAEDIAMREGMLADAVSLNAQFEKMRVQWWDKEGWEGDSMNRTYLPRFPYDWLVMPQLDEFIELLRTELAYAKGEKE